MKKLITASVLVAFMGAVAFASLHESNASGNKANTKKEQKKQEVKKKECKHTCPFSSM